MLASLQPVRRRSVSDEVFDQLAGQIVGGALAPGDALPAERSLTEQLQVNRQAVREALKRLAQAGLVEITHGGATRVSDYRRSGGLDLLPRLVLRPDGTLDPAVVRSILELRASIGADVARLAAQRATVDAAGAVTAAADGLGALTDEDLVGLARADLALWDALVDAADNVAYRLAMNSLRAVYEPAIGLLAPVLAPELTDRARHRQLAEAVARGDGARAERVARALLAAGSAAVAGALAVSGSATTSGEPS